MTTICYKDGVIAYDSRRTIGEIITNNSANKMRSHQGVRFFLAGAVDEMQALVDAYFGKAAPCVNGAHGFAVDAGQVFYVGICEDGGYFKSPISSSSAFGSGRSFAMGAMDAGATAKEAVKVAIGRDIYSGGRIRVYKIDK